MKPEGRDRQHAERRFHFTKSVLAALAPEKDKRITVYDTDVPRLACRIAPGGTRSFYVVKKHAGVVEWVKLGTLSDISVEAARKRALVILGQFAEGKNPAEAKREAKAELTGGEAFKLYLRDREARGVRSIEDLRAQWQRYLGQLPEVTKKKHGRERTKHPAGVNWENKKLGTISSEKVKALHSGIGATHPIQANRVVETLSAMFNFLGLENPTKGIKPFPETKRDRFLLADELPKFFDALRQDTSEDFREMVLVSLLAGTRIGNTCGMRWADVHFDRGVWAIPAPLSKNKEAMCVPLIAEVIDILKARRERDPKGEFVFAAASKSGHRTRPKKRWKQLLDRTEFNELAARIREAGVEFEPRRTDGTESIERALERARATAAKHKVNTSRARIEDVRPHDLRRSLASYQAMAGSSLPIIGRSLGHRDAKSTQIYARLTVDSVRDSVNKAASAILVAGGMKPTAKVRPIRSRKPRLVK